MRCRSLLLLLPFALLFSACGPNYVYEKTYELPDESWAYADSLAFEFELLDTNAIYNLWLRIEYAESFPTQNLYTRVHTRFPAGEQIAEPLSLELANKMGQWQGQCRSGYCQLDIPIQQGAYFSQAGEYRILLEQYMRQDSIGGVSSVGFLLEKTEAQR